LRKRKRNLRSEMSRAMKMRMIKKKRSRRFEYLSIETLKVH